MTLSPDQPQREITSDERRRMARTFLWILLAFVAGVALMVAVLSVQGRAAREYGSLVIQAAGPQNAQATFDRPCAQVLPGKPVPPNVISCVLEVHQGQPTAVLKVEGERQYRVTR
ncbi:hypothetical protein [Deinococcus sp. PESE-13]